MVSDPSISIGIVGARGYVGTEMIRLIAQHPCMQLAYAVSRSQSGKPVPTMTDMKFVDAGPEQIGLQRADAVILAVPDGATKQYLRTLDDAVVLDLSSDHRFDNNWVYGLSEHHAQALQGARRISNPGCYATAIQLALYPLLGLIDDTPHAFGVSGYSGAGTTPSPHNDHEILTDGITPYRLVGHTHEREVTEHLGIPVRFSPHVAPFFRGITVTVQARTCNLTTAANLTQIYMDAYTDCRLIQVLGEQMPRVQEIVGNPGARIGGITVGNNGNDIAVVCAIDNLLKGAASQAIQNLNLAFNLPGELGLLEGVPA